MQILFLFLLFLFFSPYFTVPFTTPVFPNRRDAREMSTEVSSPGDDVLGWVTETAIRAGFAGVVGSDQDLLPLLQQQQQEQEGEQHAHSQLDRRNSSGQVDEEEEQQHWNRLGMLLMVSTMAALGTLGNIFAIAAVMTEDHLKKKGEQNSLPPA